MKPIEQNSGLVEYKRGIDKMEITGPAKDVKMHILLDQISCFIRWLIPKTILSFTFAKAGSITSLLKWLKQKLPFMIFVMVMEVFLSG